MLTPFEEIRLVMWSSMAPVEDGVGLWTHSEVSELNPELVGGSTSLSISGTTVSGLALLANSSAVVSTRLRQASAIRAALSTIQSAPRSLADGGKLCGNGASAGGGVGIR